MTISIRHAVPLACAASCVSAPTLRALDDAAPRQVPAAPRPMSTKPPATLAEVLDAALARNPELRESKARLRAAIEGRRARARFPDPRVKIEAWAVPLARPWAYDEAQMLMVGVEQELPAPGALEGRAKVALDEVEIARQAVRMKALDVVASVRRSWADYRRAADESAIHGDHVALSDRLLEVARAHLATGEISQSDVLRLAVERARVHGDLAQLEQERVTARALLNALMGRAPDAAIGPPAEETAAPALEDEPPPADLADLPEIQSASAAVRRSEHRVAAARSEARWPSFMAGVDYAFMPAEHETRHAYFTMFGFTLPWLNPSWDELAREAEANAEADRSALEAAEVAAQFRLRTARARVAADRETLRVIEESVLPTAQMSVEALEAGLAAGRSTATDVLDALRTLLLVRIEKNRAHARLETSLADLDRALGRLPAGVEEELR